MYYKILEKAFHQDELHIKKQTIENLDTFIREQLDLGFRYLNPYKFADVNNISLDKGIQLFLLFTDCDSLFKPMFFIDCPNCIGERIHIEDDEQEYLYCDECRNEFRYSSIKEKLYVMFVLNDEIVIPDTQKRYTRTSLNSTFNIIQGSPEMLKKDYPLSSDREKEDMGNNSQPTLSKVDQINKHNGNVISKSTESLINSIFSFEVN